MKCVIVDDRRTARDVLRRFLAKHRDVEIVGEAADIRTATELIGRTKPDLLFLDVQLPDGDGFSLLDKLDYRPEVVLTTGHPQYAVRAFDINALDYLPKPYDRKRLDRSIDRARLSVKETASTTAVKGNGRLFLRQDKERRFVDVGHIVLILADREYTHLRDKRGRVFVENTPLKYWIERLPSEFIALDRSTIVNFRYIESVKTTAQAGTELQITGVPFPVRLGRAGSTRLRASLGSRL